MAFTDALSNALTKDMSEIKETELDHPGQVERLHLEFESNSGFEDVFVDKLGRLIVPNDDKWRYLKSVHRGNGHGSQKVVRIEKRYEGDQETDLVIYLAAAVEVTHAQVD